MRFKEIQIYKSFPGFGDGSEIDASYIDYVVLNGKKGPYDYDDDLNGEILKLAYTSPDGVCRVYFVGSPGYVRRQTDRGVELVLGLIKKYEMPLSNFRSGNLTYAEFGCFKSQLCFRFHQYDMGCDVDLKIKEFIHE